ncbi:hypothetical protein L1049_022123 [Liquidambar formosana]|uniref:Stress-response A/B barrel domain-containing protein n=1 Tax=Liquidambar formosana TaxID=63359 RepID=A0AAP0WNS2_LIQFO
MLCLSVRTLASSPFSHTFSPPKHLLRLKPSFSHKPFSPSSPSKFSTKMSSSQTIEHIVLFHVKDDTDPSKVTAMVNGLSGLSSLDQVLHLTAGPILRNRSSSFNFTHMLHSRYKSKEDLSNYSTNPKHMSVVKECVLPICDDIMAVDWVAVDLDGPVSPNPGSAMRLTFLKVKEGLGETEKSEILGVIGGIRACFGSIDQISFGENFSPARAKGFSIASVAVFPGLNELDAVDSNKEMVALQKDKVREYLDSVIVLDYVIPPPQSASL